MARILTISTEVPAVRIRVIIVRREAVSLILITQQIILHELVVVLIMSPDHLFRDLGWIEAPYLIDLLRCLVILKVHVVHFGLVASGVAEEHRSLAQSLLLQINGSFPMMICRHVSASKGSVGAEEGIVLRFVDEVELVLEVIVCHVLVCVESVSSIERLISESNTDLSWRKIPSCQVKPDVWAKRLKTFSRRESWNPNEGIRVVHVCMEYGFPIVGSSIGGLLTKPR